jgi:hypothetical protein
MKKICRGCGEERDGEEDFNWKYKNKGIRHSRCKYCMAQVCRKHYKDNKQAYIARNLIRNPLIREDNQRKIAVFLSYHPCIDCGQTDIRVLEFDHVRGCKSGHISKMVQAGYSWSTIENEISKCDIRCANCHRIKTGQVGHSWRSFFPSLHERLSSDAARSRESVRNTQVRVENMQRLHVYFSTHPCADCGNPDIRVLEFDHVFGIKFNDVGSLLANTASWPRIEAEIAKCEVRCANCHRIKTIERGQWWRGEHSLGGEDASAPLQ